MPAFADATVYYLPGAAGWEEFYCGQPVVLWNPLIQTDDPDFGFGPGGFGFNIMGTPDIPFVVEACTNLESATWIPRLTNSLANGSFHFSDPDRVSEPSRFYRLRSP